MSRFLGGFFLASLLWAGLLYAQVTGIISLGPEEEAPAVAAPEPDQEEDDAQDAPKARRKRPARPRRKLAGTATSGDELGGPGVRELNAAEGGGEGQLRQSEVEAGFDRAFPQVRRCLMLAASEDPITGRLIFGMRIAGSGQVTKVNLKGPAAITRSEAGDCMRDAVRRIHYRTFDGPDMVVHYPFTLE